MKIKGENRGVLLVGKGEGGKYGWACMVGLCDGCAVCGLLGRLEGGKGEKPWGVGVN